MNPVIGLDVANGESQGKAFLDKGKPFGKDFRIDWSLSRSHHLIFRGAELFV
jgi:hypothetical protein